MNKIFMKTEILLKHKKYILESNLEKKIENLKRDYDKELFSGKEKIEIKDTKILKQFRDEHIKLMEYIEEELKKLEIGDKNIFLDTPKELAEKINKVNTLCPTISNELNNKSKIGTKYSNKILALLGYEKFSCKKITLKKGCTLDIMKYKEIKDMLNDNWSAYQYLLELGIKVCPYCNRQYITPIYSDNGKVRADLDHFFSKSQYPFLSMSIYNLVPSCKFCNSSLKGTKEFVYNENLNPFESNVADYLEFDIIPKSYQSFYGNDNFVLKLREKDNKNKKNNEKAKKNCEIFKIEEIYQYHNDIIKNIILKKMIYSDRYIKKAYKNYNKLQINNEDIKYILLSPYIGKKDNDKPLSMLINNIIDKL